MIDRSLTRRTLARQAAYAAASMTLLGASPVLAQAPGKAGTKVCAVRLLAEVQGRFCACSAGSTSTYFQNRPRKWLAW